MAETLLVPLSGRSARSIDVVRRLLGPVEPVVFPLAQLADGGRHILRARRYDRLVFAGAPPTDELGYGFGTFIALLTRPADIALVDLEREEVRSEPLLRYIARSVPFAVGQMAASAAMLAGQRLAISAGRRPTIQKTHSSRLTKVVYLRPAVGSTSGVGGSVTHSHEVIRALRSERVAVEAYTTDAAIAETAAHESQPACDWHLSKIPRVVKAIPASAAAGGDAALIRGALAGARAADLIYQRHARFSLAGALLARLSGRPLFLEFNGSEQFIGRYWNRTPLSQRLAACENVALNAAARIIVVSDLDRRFLLKRGINAERIVVNPNGVDANRFAIGGGARIRARHGIGRKCLLVGFLGSFGPWHGAPVLVRAFAELAERMPSAHLLLVGDGVELEPARRILLDAELDARATLTGQVPAAEVPSYLDACDILVAPHVPLPGGVEFFGSPTKLFEYMAAGKAIVASRLGQIGEVLEHGVTAWMVEPGDMDDLREALLGLADSPELRRELGTNARRQAIDYHSWQQNARRVIDAYAALARDGA